MKSLIRGFALICVATAATVSPWEQFKLQFKKGYRSNVHEEERKAIFMTTLEEVEAHNAKYDVGLSTYKQGINFYADWTWDEFKNTVLMREIVDAQLEKKVDNKFRKAHASAPDAHDWKDMMNDVKNQGQCGSCWAFGAVGAVEGQYAIAGQSGIIMAEQMLIDCGMGDCNGGWADRAFDTIKTQGGCCLEDDYPYTAHNGHGCKVDQCTEQYPIAGYHSYNVKNIGIEKFAESIYNNGPHTVYVYANSNFQRYHSGIFDDPSCSQSSYNHAVINVGYDKSEGYWTIRNSWASGWGENGHIRMIMGKNTCNIEHYAWVPYL